MMSERLDPRVDIAFKKIFGVEENKDLLISLINAVVSEEDQISDVMILNPYNPKDFKMDKLSILDIKARGCNGRFYNIEIQITDEGDYSKRALYYWAKLYCGQLQQAGNYSELEKSIGIHILNFTSLPHEKGYHNTFRIRSDSSGSAYFEDLEMHTLELSKFHKKGDKDLSSLVSRIKSRIDLWLMFLTSNDLLNTRKDNLPEEFDDVGLKKAMSVLDYMNLSDEERDAYEDHRKWLMIEENTLQHYEKKGVAKGLAKGLKQGRKQGKEEGLKQGKEEGLKEGKLETAGKMLSDGLSIDLISQYTGLTISEIKQLK